MLIPSERHRPEDLVQWAKDERVDEAHARLPVMRRREKEALDALEQFVAEDQSGYLGVSWGKDSVVVAHLLHRLGINYPIVWVKIEPLHNPDCEFVRDQFLGEHPRMDYDEIAVDWWPEQQAAWARHARSGSTHSLGLSPEVSAAAQGFDVACGDYGDRHVSGVRAEESGRRAMRMKTWGHSSLRTCAPIGWWSTADVFAYLHAWELPVHPAYAMTYGGVLERNRLRVDAFGGGKGSNRAEWEGRYYPDRIRYICDRALSPAD